MSPAAWTCVCLGELIVHCGLAFDAADPSADAQNISGAALPGVTNVFQFDQLAEQADRGAFTVHLEGVIRWANADGSLVIVQDDSGAVLVETESRIPPIQPGQKALVTGDASVNGSGTDIRVGPRLLVNNHAPQEEQEQSAAIVLEAGKHPFCVAWLAGNAAEHLEVYFQGPGLTRQTIPDSALFRKVMDPAAGAVKWSQGLDCRIFTGRWAGWPDFRQLKPVKTTVAGNFDLGVKPQRRNVALQFCGYIEAPRDGLYHFSLVSAGSSQLFIGCPRLEATGAADLSAPQPLTPGEVLPPELKSMWAAMEGLVTFASRKGLNGYRLELSSGTGRSRVNIDDGSGISPELLSGSRVQVSGICRSAYTVDGQTTAGLLWTPGAAQVKVLETAYKRWQVQATNLESGELPVLTALGRIMHMQRGEAMRGYPVSIRGVIIWSRGDTCHICDSSGGIYVDAREIEDKNSLPLRAGEYREIEGVTEFRFSPVVVARRASRLGLGTPPEPAQPTRDELLNGTWDAQYVELEGIVMEVNTNRLTMRTRGGNIEVYLVPPTWDEQPSLHAVGASIQRAWSETRLAAFKSYEGALVRVRGSLAPVKNPVTWHFKVGEIQMRAPSVSVDRPAPAEPFAAPAKRVVELLMFDAGANALQPVKVTGQIVQEHAGEFYLMDGNRGLRFTPRKPLNLACGDRVEVVGFPELGGASPRLLEADARKIGTSPLPRPERLPTDAPLVLDAAFDSTRVELEARLMSLGVERDDRVLGLRMGPHFFLARLDKQAGSVDAVPVGSLLDLTGVYVGHVSAVGQGVDSFELLLNSPSDVRVVARPSWWTLKRLAGLVGTMAGIIVGSFLWIGLLRRQVEQRTVQLRREIHERERAEHRRVLESERARIAQDIHDDLGASLTRITMLSQSALSKSERVKAPAIELSRIYNTARSLTGAMDEIVWAINPSNDTLESLASYFAEFVGEFLAPIGLRFKLEMPLALPEWKVPSELRHNLFLAFKEALHNVAKHSNATEVVVALEVGTGGFALSVEDDGSGFDAEAMAGARFETSRRGGGNGLLNMRRRLEDLGGHCIIESRPGCGTRVSFEVELPP